LAYLDQRRYNEIKNSEEGAMIDSIGDTAGKVWKFLEEKGEANLSQLKKGVKADPNLTLQAIGWLAREGKLRIEKKDRYIIYALKK
jgi:hypothetical protein